MTDRHTLPPAHWIASYPKSGNTWVRLFLESYLCDMNDINAVKIATVSDINAYTYQVVSPMPIESLAYETTFMLRDAAIAHLLITSRITPRIIKTHNANMAVLDISLINSAITKSAVYLVRDPRDVAVSLAEHTGITIDDCITNMSNASFSLVSPHTPAPHYLSSWSDHVASWSVERSYPITYVRYEQLLQDPEHWFVEILKAYGIKVKVRRLRKAIRLCEFSRLKHIEQKRGFKETSPVADSFFNRGRWGGWRDILNEKQISRIERDNREMMTKLKYLPSNIRSIADGVAC